MSLLSFISFIQDAPAEKESSFYLSAAIFVLTLLSLLSLIIHGLQGIFKNKTKSLSSFSGLMFYLFFIFIVQAILSYIAIEYGCGDPEHILNGYVDCAADPWGLPYGPLMLPVLSGAFCLIGAIVARFLANDLRDSGYY